MSARRLYSLPFPWPIRRAEGWTSYPSRPKMHVQSSNHHRPSVRRVGPARQKPRRPIDPVEGIEVAALGGIACTVNGVRREAEVEPRLLIDYFLRESLGAHQHRKAIQSAAGPWAVRPVLEEGEPWRKDRSQVRPRLRSTLSAR